MAEPYGAIGELWRSLNAEASFLRRPISEEMEFPGEGGRVQAFEGGNVYYWPDIGAHAVGEIFVHYQGLNCFATAGGLGADEPFVWLTSVVGEGHPWRFEGRTQIYNDVNGGDTRPDQIEVYRGKPDGLTLTAVLFEHDAGEPDGYKDAMKEVASAAARGTAAAMKFIPVVGPVLSQTAMALTPVVTPLIADAMRNFVGLGDDQLGMVQTLVLSPKDMILMAIGPNLTERSVQYKFASNLIVSSDGANYKVYFGGVKTP